MHRYIIYKVQLETVRKVKGGVRGEFSLAASDGWLEDVEQSYGTS